MLENVKLLLGITSTDKDQLITLLIDLATQEAVNFTNAQVPALTPIILQMVVYKYNRLGTEGLESESYSGLTYDYISDYPDYITNQLKNYNRGFWCV